MPLDLSSGVQWWEESQLRILVLGSLSLQIFLFFSCIVRNCIGSLCRSLMWLAYLGADALAIYALATLFNRHKLPAGDDGRSAALEVLWAPVLLIHLGGQHSITAYSIEDNELWRRHILTVVSQVTVALYVFCKSWPRDGDKRLLQAAILLFVVGILKFIWKPWALKTASLSALCQQNPEASAASLRGNCERLCFPLNDSSNKDAAELKQGEEHDLSLEEYVQKARELVQVTEVDEQQAINPRPGVQMLFVDHSTPYSRRARNLEHFLKCTEGTQFGVLGVDISDAFGAIYTNINWVTGLPGCVSQLLFPFVALTSLVLFVRSHHKHDYEEKDVRVTVALLCCTALLEFLPFFLSPCLLGTVLYVNRLAQHNLMSFYARRSKPTRVMKFCALMGCSDYINKHCYTEQMSESKCREIIKLATEHLRDGWKLYIVDAPSYKRFNNFRGQWTLSRHKVYGQQLWRSFEEPFDRSVLVWHLATELCLHHPRTSSTAAARCSKLISNYMIYLLFIRPEMLMPGTRQGLFTAACHDISLMLKRGNEPPPEDATTVAEQILRTSQSPSVGDIGPPMILGACNLAKELTELVEDEEERWKVIQGVWLEMLCCCACSCRGYLHAKSMGEGMEFLTYVWILLSRMGMETFADKFQRLEPGRGLPASEPQERRAQEEIAMPV